MQLLRIYPYSFLLFLFLVIVVGCADNNDSSKALKDDWNSINAANYNKGLEAYKRKDYATALEKWTPLAEKGFAKAQINLALLYSTGRGVAIDY